MPRCKSCDQLLAEDSPFCQYCGNSRIVESLTTPRKPPEWLDRALSVATIVLGLWLLVTIGIAFLREAKALRRARAAIETNNLSQANSWIEPWLARHPNHPEALFLAGNAAIKLGFSKDAIQHFQTLSTLRDSGSKRAAERVNKLTSIFQKQLPINSLRFQCGQSQYADFYNTFIELGPEMEDALLDSAANVASKCITLADRRRKNEPAYWLIKEKGLDPARVVSFVYLRPLENAMAKKNYDPVEELAAQALAQWPESSTRVHEALSEIRGQVTLTTQKIRDLCTSLTQSKSYYNGRLACFPKSTPEEVAGQIDAWGHPFVYTAQEPDEDSKCYRGFEIASLGVELKRNQSSPNATYNPQMGVACGSAGGRRPRLVSPIPNNFWLAE